jgi:hypothetical protein
MIYQKEKQKTTRYFSQSGGSLTGSEGQQKAREHEELAQEVGCGITATAAMRLITIAAIAVMVMRFDIHHRHRLWPGSWLSAMPSTWS